MAKAETRRKRGNAQGSLFRRTPTGCWIASWYDHAGERQERTTRTIERGTAERILREWMARDALRREGVIDPRADRYATEARRPIGEHLAEYLKSCERRGQARGNIAEKRRHLERLVAEAKLRTLADLTAEALERNMADMRKSVRNGTDRETGKPRWTEADPSERTRNFRRQAAVAFLSWCVKQGRAERNHLRTVPTRDDRLDRHRVRRPLTDRELSELMRVARERDAALNADTHHRGRWGASNRAAWYMAAALAGLRRGDLTRLRWRDIDLEAGCLTIEHGKARRTDQIPLHPELAAELEAIRPRNLTPVALADRLVFPHAVTAHTVARDMKRANIGPDAEGRVADLHALRTTLGTRLARAGVAPQLAQKIMRHGDYRTTMRHYTVLGLHDTAAAMDRLAGMDAMQAAEATGTHDAQAIREEPSTRAPATAHATGTRFCAAGHHQEPNTLGRSARGAEGRIPRNMRLGTHLGEPMRRAAEVERRGLEPLTSSLQSWHSTN